MTGTKHSIRPIRNQFLTRFFNEIERLIYSANLFPFQRVLLLVQQGFSIMEKSFENSLLENWAKEMHLPMDYYRRPILDEQIVSIIKLACDTFKQEVDVFFMTVDLAEEYVYLKERRQEKVNDSFLVISVIIFITSKYFGGGADLKIPLIRKFMLKLSEVNYHCKTIMHTEQEILHVLQYKLPFSTVLDDFDTFFEKFMREYRLQEVLRPLCIQLLVLVYCTRQKWFENLEHIYKHESETFQYLLCSKLFLPAGILISAFKSTNYQYILDINGLLQDLKMFTKIHPDHIHALSTVIINLMNA